MNRTFTIISPHFTTFEEVDWIDLFQRLLVPLLPSFNAMMLEVAISDINCTNYHVV